MAAQLVGRAHLRESEPPATPKIVLIAEGVVTYPPSSGRPAQRFVLRAGAAPQMEPAREIHTS